ncbi:hypothetical protein ANCCEY_04631 [Ancylostoma ceylanicum]|uniref:Uncharacterized protein n=1 Tax=Ancylostoma ceylanicum TaxID=53326 RepID=A0A0D6LWU4_9BILA|nr:hypothetical protein ANCCEY_04631 [Ancylostoma ceylanicum]
MSDYLECKTKDRHSKEAVKLKQSSGEGGSNSHDKPSKEALKSKRSSGEGGLRPQEKPSLERVHKMSAEGRLKVQVIYAIEKQSLERIHRMSAEGKLKAQEKLSSGERIPKVTQDAKGNENKDLKKSPAKPTVVPVPTKETGKPLELKNSMRQQVLKSPTDKPKELKNSMRQQVLKSPTDKPKPTTPEKIKSGQEQVSPFVPSKQQVASKEVVHPSKQQPAIAHQPIVPPRAAQKAASPPKANKPSVQQDPGKRPPAPRSNSPVQSVFLNVPKGYSDGCQVATASAPPQSKEQYQKDQKSFDEYICFYTQGAPQPKSS